MAETREHADAFVGHDLPIVLIRTAPFYDYLIDQPERFEGYTQ